MRQSKEGLLVCLRAVLPRIDSCAEAAIPLAKGKPNWECSSLGGDAGNPYNFGMPANDRLLFVLTLLAALGSGLIAGVFYAFSTFVMRALARLPVEQGIAAMQSINVAVINPMFLGVFLGTALVCIGTAIGAFMRWDRPGAVYLLSGSIFYFVGTFLVTMIFNVPLNNALAAISPTDPETARHWAGYVSRWTAWNHVRTAAALLAMLAFILMLRKWADV